MPYVIVIAALVLLVVLHELGHFLAARWVGIRATKFYVFFPPAALKRHVGDVEYGIGWIPAGGFVKLPGMFEPEPKQVAARVTWELNQLPELSAADQLLADAARREIERAEHADQLVAPLQELRALVEQLPESAARTGSMRRLGDLLDDLHPRAYWRASLWRRMAVIAAGPLVNILVALVVLIAFYWMLFPRFATTGPLRVADVTTNSPAAAAGMTTDTRIYDWNGPVTGIEPRELLERIAEGRGKAVTVTFANRGEERRTRTIEPRVLDGSSDDIKRIGIVPEVRDVEVSGRRVTDPVRASKAALVDMREVTWGNLTRLPQVFFRSEVRREVSSVVGIVQVADAVDRAGQFVRYVGIISLVLAVMNLLPLLPLDGGHLLFGLIEAARRRPLPRLAFERYSMVGLAIVGILFFIGLNNDIGPSLR